MSTAGVQHLGAGQRFGVVVPRDQYQTYFLLRAMLPENLDSAMHVENYVDIPALALAMVSNRTQLGLLGVRLGRQTAAGHRRVHLPPVIKDLRNMVDLLRAAAG